MKFILTILLVTVLSLSFGFLLNVKEVYANDHKVKSIIIIPSDWQGKIDQGKRDKYKKAILDATRTVQTIYAKLLNGKTFDIDENIEVEDNQAPSAIINQEFEKGKPFGWNMGLVIVRWVIGTPPGPSRGGIRNRDSGVVAMRHQELLKLLEDDDSVDKKSALYILAHELGHAFSLVFSDFAQAHSCSEVSQNECKEKTPKPYPPAGEWGSIMGYGTPFWNFPDLFFNNSTINPEIRKLYRSPFINPENDPAPEPQPISIKQPLPKLFYLGFYLGSPKPITVGSQVVLSNVDSKLGKQPGKIEFYNISSNQYAATLPESDYEILKWDGESVIFLIKESAESPTTQRKWRVRIITVNNEIYESSDQIIIQGKDFKNDKQSTIAINFSATCGNGNTPLSGVTTALENTDTGSKKSYTMNNSNGKGQMSFTFDNTLQSNYNLVVEETVEISPDKKITLDIPAEPSFYPINLNDIMSNGGISNMFNFHFPNCPPAPAQTPTIYVNAIAECGGDYQPVKTKIRLIRKGDSTEVTSGETNKNGGLEFSINNYLIKSNQTYVLKADDIPNIPPAELIIDPIYHPIVIPYPPPPLISISPVFHYPTCPASLQPSPAPYPTPTPQPSFTPEPNITGNTAPYVIPPSPSPSSFCNDFVTACWKGAECLEENQDSADFVCSQNHGQGSKCTRSTSQPNTFDDGCTISASQQATPPPQGGPEPKTVAKIEIENTEVWPNPPTGGLKLALNGGRGIFTVLVSYSNSSTKTFYLTFKRPTSSSTKTCPYQENPQNCPYGGIRDCTGIRENGVCVYDRSGQVDPACQETCNPAPSSCNLVREYDECGSNGGCFGVEQEGRIYSVKQYQGSSCQQEYVCSERENCSAKGLKCENRQCVSIPCDYEENPQNCPYGGLQTCSGSIQGGECRYDSRINPNCRNRRCNQGPPACGDYQLKGSECDWGRKQAYEVYQDSCGNYDRRNYQTQPGQCGAPLQCSEDIYYCDSGRTIHKYGGYWDGNTCQYAFDDIDQPC